MVSSGGKLRFCTILLGAVLLKTDVVASAPSPSQLQVPPREPSRQACSFGTGGKMYNISDLLQCMNELASSAISQGSQSRAPEDTDQLFSAFPGGGRPYPPPFPPYPGRPDSDSFPPVYDIPGGPALQLQYQGPPVQQPEFQPGPGFYPPPPGAGFPNPLGIGFNPAGSPSIGLFDALSSISQYDDHKCVPRLLCEVATGVVPGSGSYKQASSTLEDFGKNTLVGLLTALDLGETSPVLGFAKSALLGYTSKGNPSVCYQEYVKCPRNPDDLVHYLNNHNGGFFRFFSNIGNGRPPPPQGSYPSSGSNGYGLARKQPAPPPGLSGSKSDRTGTGELRFDNPVPSARQEYGKSFFPELRSKNETTKFVFPSSKKISNRVPLNRVSKSLTSFPPGYYSDGSNNYQNGHQMSPPFFPQDGKDQDSDILYQPVQSSLQLQNQNQNSQSAMVGKTRLYMSDSLANTSTNSFTFPDGQKVKINVAFSKLFTDGYRKTLRRSFSSEQVPHPTSFDGFNMMNLADVFPEVKTRPDLQIGHPCDMICHDARGTPVQFSQAVSNTGSLNTLMSPDRPILDLSRPVPCEVMCVDRNAERRRSSTVLSQVLRPSNENTVPLQGFRFKNENIFDYDFKSIIIINYLFY